MNSAKPREIAYGVLQRAEELRRFLDDELAQALPQLAPTDRGLCQEMVFGVTRWRATIDWLIQQRTQGRPQKPGVLNILRLGLYQLFWLDRVPDHAAVFETVELARRAGHHAQAGFINAVLRHYARDREAARAQLDALKRDQPHLGWSHPQWLVQRWRTRWGDPACGQLLQWNNRPPELFVRVNCLRAEPGKLLERWRMEEDVDYDFFRADWVGENLVFRLKQAPPVAELPSFREGWFYVQDPGTLLAPSLLAPQPGDRILDLCAAPGGKTTFLAQLVRNEARIVARDTVPARLALLRENCARLGATCIVPELAPSPGGPASAAPEPPSTEPGPAGYFDRILIDAPCSNTGVMRRRVELRWRVRLEEITRLQRVQLDLLRQAAPNLRDGGTLVYSTCSLEPEENEEVVRQFLAEVPGFRLDTERSLTPFRDQVDGAYAARMIKERSPQPGPRPAQPR